jgi:hypothetical protein
VKFSFKQSEQERLEVNVPGYERDHVGEYWDDNWLKVEIHIRVGGFQGKATATIITSEMSNFLEKLRSLHQSLSESAEFATLEEQLGLRVDRRWPGTHRASWGGGRCSGDW